MTYAKLGGTGFTVVRYVGFKTIMYALVFILMFNPLNRHSGLGLTQAERHKPA